MPSVPFLLCRRCGRISSSKKRACCPYIILRVHRYCHKLYQRPWKHKQVDRGLRRTHIWSHRRAPCPSGRPSAQ